MTVEEAKALSKECDRNIYNSFREMRTAATAMSNAAYDAAYDARRILSDNENVTVTKYTGLCLLVSVVGVILFFAEVYFWAVVLVIGGIVLAYNVYQKLSAGSRERLKNADTMVNVVKQQQSTLLEILEKNNSIG